MLFILGMGRGCVLEEKWLKTYLQPVNREETRGKLL